MKKMFTSARLGRVALVAAVALFVAFNCYFAKSKTPGEKLTILPTAFADPPEGVGSGSLSGVYDWSYVGYADMDNPVWDPDSDEYVWQYCDEYIGTFVCTVDGPDRGGSCFSPYFYYDNCNIYQDGTGV